MKKNFWKENGILISLYGVVGVLVITAGVLTVNTLTPPDDEFVQENVEVQSSLVDSYREQMAKIQEENSNDNEIEKLKESLKQNENKEEKEVDSTTSKKEVKPLEEKNTPLEKINNLEEDGEQLEPKKEPTNDEKTSKEDNKTSSIYEENDVSVSHRVVEHELEQINKGEKEPDVKTKTNDKEESQDLKTSKLTWPVEGAIIMPFDNKSLVYDETLNLYRTNDSISITADKGQEIVASADGKIIEIGSNELDRGYIVVDHGNEYSTKYSQLVENFIVKKGDQVRRGQIIGHIGEPATQVARQGTHLQYSVVKNDVNVDPLTYLQ